MKKEKINLKKKKSKILVISVQKNNIVKAKRLTLVRELLFDKNSELDNNSFNDWKDLINLYNSLKFFNNPTMEIMKLIGCHHIIDIAFDVAPDDSGILVVESVEDSVDVISAVFSNIFGNEVAQSNNGSIVTEKPTKTILKVVYF